MSASNEDVARGISASKYASATRQLVEMVDNMRSLGVSSELDLPRVVLIGSQSVGKSSLVEAISGIKVPRDSNTCTRCPMEVRLRSSRSKWSCKVSLRFETKEDGSPVDVVREIPFGPTITKPDEVEGILRRAQLAILNPSVSDVPAFVKLSDADVLRAKEKEGKAQLVAGSISQLRFSDNLVVVDVSGPTLTDLAFLDLPGIISTGDHPGDVETVKKMVEKSIGGNSLILLVISMKDDYQNQGAPTLATAADPTGMRTIGVLTKPDAVQAGEHDYWIGMLEGKKHPLAGGYYCVKLASTEALRNKLSAEDVRSAEVEFFRAQDPWNKLADKYRLGVENFVNSLSNRLNRLISEKLPTLQADLKKSLASVLADIKFLPPAPSGDPRGELQRRVGRLTHDIEGLARDGSRALVQAKKDNDQRFKAALLATRPVFTPFAANETEKREEWIKGQEGATSEENAGDDGGEVGKSTLNGSLLRMNLDEVHRHIESHKGRELPLNTPYDATSTLALSATSLWSDLAYEALEHLRMPVQAGIRDLVKVYFDESTNPELRTQVAMSIDDVVSELFDQAQHRLDDMIELDTLPFTLNTHYYTAVTEKMLNKFKEARQDKPLASQDLVDKAIAALAHASIQGLTSEDLVKLQKASLWEEELDLMAQTMAYWKVAYKRLLDNVPRVLDFAVIFRLSSAIQDNLLSGVCAGDEAQIARLMAEDSNIAQRRSQLGQRRQRLVDAKRVLTEFGHET